MIMELKTIRDLINYLLNSCGDVDDPVNVKLVRRDENNVVTHYAILPISYIDMRDNICVEEKDIKWEAFH